MVVVDPMPRPRRQPQSIATVRGALIVVEVVVVVVVVPGNGRRWIIIKSQRGGCRVGHRGRDDKGSTVGGQGGPQPPPMPGVDQGPVFPTGQLDGQISNRFAVERRVR